MFSKLFFKYLSQKNQIDQLRRNGVLLGTRNKEERRVYVYMLSKQFVEVMYKNDRTENTPEKIQILPGLKSLNDYLEREFRANFGTAL
jgi:hypothetical protein